MKPQLTEEQRKIIADIASHTALLTDTSVISIERAILQAFDELVPEMAKDAERYRWLRDRRITGKGIPCLAYFRGVLVLCDDMSSTEVDSAIDAAIAQER